MRSKRERLQIPVPNRFFLTEALRNSQLFRLYKLKLQLKLLLFGRVQKEFKLKFKFKFLL